MSFNDPFEPGTLLRLRKKHPCGSDLWLILSIGAFVELECRGCGKRKVFDPLKLRQLALSREPLE